MPCIQSGAFFFVSIMFSVLLASPAVVRAEVPPASSPLPAGTSFILEEVDPYAVKVFQSICVVEDQLVLKGTPTKNCTKTLLTSAGVTVTYGDRSLKLTPTTKGIVRLPLSQIGYIETTAQDVGIVWQYAGAGITTHVNISQEQKQSVISKYLEDLSESNLFSIQLSEQSDFDKSAQKLKDKIRESMPKYYHIQKAVTNGVNTSAENVAYQLVPSQQRMYYSYGDFTGNAELPVIAFRDSPSAVLIKTSIINSLLPAYQNEDRDIIVTFKDEAVKVTNKTSAQLQLDRLTIFYNGTFIDNLLERPLKLAPSTISSEIPVADIVEKKLSLRAKQQNLSAKEAQQMKINFGFGAAYHDLQSKTVSRTGLVNTYSVYELVRNNVDTAKLEEHMALLANDRNNSPADLKFNLKVEFDTGKYAVKKEYLSDLQKLGMAMQKYSVTKLIIEGHTDDSGDEKLNLKLSDNRALAVKQYLVQTFGIEPGRIETVGFGQSRPLADNGTPEGRTQNRRVEGRYISSGLK